MSIGSKIRYYRNKARLSQEELAALVAMKKCSISRYEKDIRMPTLDVLEKIAAATGNRLVIDFQKIMDHEREI